MNSYQLSWRTQPVGLIDGRSLRPDVLGALSIDEVAKQPIPCGRRTYTLGELYHIEPLEVDSSETTSETPPSEAILVMEGSPNFVRLGAGMKSGVLEISGHGGAMIGAAMTGGEIYVSGSVGPRAAAGMRGGQLHVFQDAEELLGGPLPGGITGMTGGAILVQGNVGDYLALKQRRGLIAIGGSVGRHPAMGMLGGTLVLNQENPPRPGLGMEGGTIVLLRGSQNTWSSFPSNATTSPTFFRLLWRRLAELAFPLSDDIDDALFRSFSGDTRTNSRGEIFARIS